MNGLAILPQNSRDTTAGAMGQRFPNLRACRGRKVGIQSGLLFEDRTQRRPIFRPRSSFEVVAMVKASRSELASASGKFIVVDFRARLAPQRST
jgi:hypothetical protein